MTTYVRTAVQNADIRIVHSLAGLARDFSPMITDRRTSLRGSADRLCCLPAEQGDSVGFYTEKMQPVIEFVRTSPG